MNNTAKANVSMVVSKTFTGLNLNALKFLVPLWISPFSGTMMRCVFAAIVFWIISFFSKTDNTTTRKTKLSLFLLGAILLFTYLLSFIVGINTTTPVSASIFSSLQPIWVFLITVLFFKQKAPMLKVIGIAIGLAGALLCILSQKPDDLASDPMTGNLFCLLSSVTYAVYLIISGKVLKKVPIVTMLKYTFGGAAFSSIIMIFITGFEAPVLSEPIFSKAFLILMFVLIFPTVIGNFLIPIGLKYLSTTLVSIYGYLVLVITTVVALAVGQDRFHLSQFIAILMICSSVYLVEIADAKTKNDSSSTPNSPASN